MRGFDCPVLGQVSFDECLAHARQLRGKPPCGFGLYTLLEMSEKLTEADPELEKIFARNPFTFRVSTLSGPCAREAVLGKYFPSQYIAPQSAYWLTRGSWWHAIKEKYSQQAVGVESELRLAMDVVLTLSDGTAITVQVTGKFDNLQEWETTVEDRPGEASLPTIIRTLTDYKTSDWLPDRAKPDHELQLNLYNLLLEANGFPKADELQVEYLGMKGEAIREAQVWDSDTTFDQLRERILPILTSRLAFQAKLDREFGGNEAAFLEQAEPEDAEIESLLPLRLNPLDKAHGGWKCAGYCSHTHQCWPNGVPGNGENGSRSRTVRK